jgi:hypothetical protein
MAVPAPISILLIGNSFTQRNDLPGLFAAMAQERSVRIRHKLISAGGASLRRHWNAGRTAKEIAIGKYDYVVLQEQSTLPVKNSMRMAETCGCSTCARQFAPESQKAITDASNSIRKEIGALVVPVGDAWLKFIAKHKQRCYMIETRATPRSPDHTWLPACS